MVHGADANAGTHNGFKGVDEKPTKIDYIFVKKGTPVLDAEVDRTDHFPSTATIILSCGNEE